MHSFSLLFRLSKKSSKPSNTASTIPPPPKSKPKPKPGTSKETETKSSPWKTYCYIALWFILSIVGLIAGFYLEVYLVARHDKVPGEEGDIVADEDIVADGLADEL